MNRKAVQLSVCYLEQPFVSPATQDEHVRVELT